MHVSVLPREVFRPLPSGVSLPGSPRNYTVSTYECTLTGGNSEQLALRHMLAAYIQHGEWSALSISSLQQALRDDFTDNLVIEVSVGLRQLFGHGLIHFDAVHGGIVWPAQAFLDEIECYLK